jgi:hypothetical protein
MLVFSYDSNQDKMVLSGVDSTMEYKLKSGQNKSWQDCTDTPMYFDIPDIYTYYYFRYKEIAQGERSYITQVGLLNRPSLSSVTYNRNTETISGLTTEMVMSINDSTYSPVTETTLAVSDIIDDLDTGETATVNVMQPATATRAPSNPKTFTLYPRLSSPSGVTYNPVSIALSGTNSAMEYRLSTATSWSSISGSTVNLISLISTTEDQTIYVRNEATSTSAASEYISFTIPMLIEGPDCTLNTDTETISGFESDTEYEYTTTANPTYSSTWYDLDISDVLCDISSQISTSNNKTIHIRKSATSTTPATNFTSIALPKREAAPAEAIFNYTDTDNYDKAVLEGISDAMEYRLSTATQWQDISGDSIVFEIPTSSVTYYVRTKATETDFASSHKSLTLYTRPSAPSCSYNTTTENITSLDTSNEISINGGAYFSATSTTYNLSEIVDDIDSGDTLEIYIRKAATSTRPASAVLTLSVNSRLSIPTSVTYNPVTMTLSGTSSSMQYKLLTATSWSSISSSTVNLKSLASSTSDIVVQLRYKPTNTASASQILTFTIAQLLPGPDCEIDYINQSLTGLSNNIQYQYYIGSNPSSSSSWTNITVVDESFDLSDLITTSNRTFNIRKSETTTSPYSNYTTLTINAKPVAPTTPEFTYNNPSNYGMSVLSGINNTMEYCLSTSSAWTPITTETIVFDIPEANQTYYIRYKSTGTAFASRNSSLTLYKSSSAPGATYSTTTEKISSLSTSYEISFNGGAYSDCTATTMLMTDLINNNTPGSNLIVNIRTSATSSRPASLIKTITIYPRLSTPSSVTYNTAAIALNNTASGMQYRLTSSTSWTSITTSTVNLKQHVNANNDVSLELRYSPTSSNSASLPVTFTIPHLLSGPDGYLDYANESISGLDTDQQYQYYIGTSPIITSSSWLSATIIDGEFDISSIVTSSSKTVNLRYAETATSPISTHTAFSVSGRPSAPSTVSVSSISA